VFQVTIGIEFADGESEMTIKSPSDPKDRVLIGEMHADGALADAAAQFIERSFRYKYTYNFSWLGRPIIQHPQDIIAFQEIIWKTRPTLIIETGIAHGGSLIFSASMLELCGDGEVIGVDVDIRPHNRVEIERHPLAKRITLIEGSSTDPVVVTRIAERAKQSERTMVILDSNHTHNHVLSELNAYSRFVSSGCYLIVCDTVIADFPDELLGDRPWTRADNPLTAVRSFLTNNQDFKLDTEYSEKLLISHLFRGYLRRVKA
jgi:cephalosporin hydroxylase